MKKVILAFCFLTPFFLHAQLDQLHAGMSVEEFHKKFPKAVPDMAAMTCSMYKQDTLLGVPGESQFIAVKDSVKSYFFRSVSFDGPNSQYPKADSTSLEKLLRAQEELVGHYSDIFGAPTSKFTNNPRIKGSENAPVSSATWQKPDANIKVEVKPVLEIENFINAPAGASEKKKKSGSYVLEITAEGKWTKLRIDFEIGITKAQFRALMPALSSQVKDFPDCWMLDDTLAGRDSHWHYWFIENKLAGFSFDCYAGNTYGGVNKTVYPFLIKKARQFTAEEQRSYGNATVLQAPTGDNYVPIKKVPNAFFYDDIYYNAEWEMGNGKELFIRLHENGGKGESFLHLEVYFGEKKD